MSETIALAGKRVAIANRGEIAVRIAATVARLGAIPVVLLGDPDLDGFAARSIGRVERIGEAGSELDVALVIAAAQRAGAEFLHPGYGFLSERAALAEACEATGIRFVGPSPETLLLCGDKLETRSAAVRASVPVLPASPPLEDEPALWAAEADRVGYPLLVKPAGAGGGRGLRHVADATSLRDAVAASRREGATSGAGAVVYLEREMIAPRHVEVQVISDGHRAFAIGDRDCSLQRRHQKVIEEAPAPNIDDATRSRLHTHARDLASDVGLQGIATCEFMLSGDGELAFLEINPRIQVEHPVTEIVTGIDLVEWQLRIAAGECIPPDFAFPPRGHAIEARVYAEDPAAGFLPAPGTLTTVAWPVRPNLRVDAGYGTGDVVPHAYDPMLAKVIAHGSDRDSAIAELRTALGETVVAGVTTNIGWLLDLLDAEPLLLGHATTQTANEVPPSVRGFGVAPFAALAWSLDRSVSDSVGPWSSIGPWRISGSATVSLHGDGWERQFAVMRNPTGWTVMENDTTYRLTWWRDVIDVWTVAVDDTVARVATTPQGNGVEVTGLGGRWQVTLGPRPSVASARTERRGDGLIRAPMPSSVVSVHVSPGDRVEAGQPLVTLTAMKMEIVCATPESAVVESIACQPGDLVAADQVLVTLRLEGATSTIS